MRSVFATGIAAVSALLMLSCPVAEAQAYHTAPVTTYVEDQVKPWLHDPLILSTLKAQNAQHAALTPADIAALDLEWRSEILSGDHHLIDAALSNPASMFLKARQDASGGAITELFLMDANGLNVAQSNVTSDYWQGDEDKFARSFGAGKDAIFIGEPEQDESTQVLQTQASITICDENGVPIGALTVGLNLDYL